MDVQMPEMDGFEATCLIRDPRTGILNRNIPVIAMARTRAGATGCTAWPANSCEACMEKRAQGVRD